jgi:ABC-type antimicrobial peptide transport system permease subunit
MGISLLTGSDFSTEPSDEFTVVVNRALAEELFPGQNAQGRSFYFGDRQVRIVGVVANTKFAALQETEARAILYRPMLDTDLSTLGFGGPTLIIRGAGAAAPSGEVVLRTMREIDPELATRLIGSMRAHVQGSLFVPRLTSTLFGVAGMMGLLIASIGIYGVVSFAVARRTREIGIRLALGARSAQVTWTVLRHGALLALAGIAMGLVGGMALAATAGSLIYGVSAKDPLTFGAVPVILLSVSLLATAIPARRAARVDPSRTLRAE